MLAQMHASTSTSRGRVEQTSMILDGWFCRRRCDRAVRSIAALDGEIKGADRFEAAWRRRS